VWKFVIGKIPASSFNMRRFNWK